MKKTLVAIAALAASAGAFAQSNVTLFGVIDASVARVSTGGNHVAGLATGDQTSNRLGFRGTEDLGGGLRAGFWLEGGFNVDAGSGSTNGAFGFERRATVSLESKSAGELRIGRDKLPSYLNIETFDPFADIGIGGLGASNLISSSAAGTPGGSAPKRASNSVQYILPSTLGGFYGQAMYAFGETNSSQANDKQGNAYNLRGGYKAGAINFGLGYGEVRGGALTLPGGVDYKTTTVGASYDFGFVKPMVQFVGEKGGGQKREVFEIAATAPIGAGELRAAFSTYRNKTTDNADADKFAIGYGYNLSKRTQVYGTVARVNNDGLATRGLAVSGLTQPTIAAGRNVTGYEIGVRHSF
ncbi:porin [Xylophilus sp. GOD-11R]|uniref:porin n=1 Tax=Xylophilus sp. GOD-11R TaxID=3089814 RepID=UPI00298C4038|nr:porin [Xylophilus sp. GOD-11R]WPB56940.1 porin [Xylophilus sp. GOD-11R]